MAKARELGRMAIALARRALAEANPHLSPEEVDLAFVDQAYGRDLGERLCRFLRQRRR